MAATAAVPAGGRRTRGTPGRTGAGGRGAGAAGAPHRAAATTCGRTAALLCALAAGIVVAAAIAAGYVDALPFLPHGCTQSNVRLIQPLPAFVDFGTSAAFLGLGYEPTALQPWPPSRITLQLAPLSPYSGVTLRYRRTGDNQWVMAPPTVLMPGCSTVAAPSSPYLTFVFSLKRLQPLDSLCGTLISWSELASLELRAPRGLCPSATVLTIDSGVFETLGSNEVCSQTYRWSPLQCSWSATPGEGGGGGGGRLDPGGGDRNILTPTRRPTIALSTALPVTRLTSRTSVAALPLSRTEPSAAPSTMQYATATLPSESVRVTDLMATLSVPQPSLTPASPDHPIAPTTGPATTVPLGRTPSGAASETPSDRITARPTSTERIAALTASAAPTAAGSEGLYTGLSTRIHVQASSSSSSVPPSAPALGSAHASMVQLSSGLGLTVSPPSRSASPTMPSPTGASHAVYPAMSGGAIPAMPTATTAPTMSASTTASQGANGMTNKGGFSWTDLPPWVLGAVIGVVVIIVLLVGVGAARHARRVRKSYQVSSVMSGLAPVTTAILPTDQMPDAAEDIRNLRDADANEQSFNGHECADMRDDGAHTAASVGAASVEARMSSVHRPAASCAVETLVGAACVPSSGLPVAPQMVGPRPSVSTDMDSSVCNPAMEDPMLVISNPLYCPADLDDILRYADSLDFNTAYEVSGAMNDAQDSGGFGQADALADFPWIPQHEQHEQQQPQQPLLESDATEDGIAARFSDTITPASPIDEMMETALTLIRSSNANALRDWLVAGSDRREASDGDGNTLLHLAAQYGSEAAARVLLETPDIAVNSLNRHGETPLLAACGSLVADEAALVATVNLLCAHGAGMHVVDVAGVTPLMAASKCGHDALLAALRNQHARQCHDAIAAATPYESLEHVLSWECAVDRRGWTSLHWAAACGNVSTVRCLLDEPDVRGKLGQRLLHMQSLRGETALHLAVREDHAAVVQELLAHGANALIADHSCRTSLQLARAFGNECVIRLVETSVARITVESAYLAGRELGVLELLAHTSGSHQPSRDRPLKRAPPGN